MHKVKVGKYTVRFDIDYLNRFVLAEQKPLMVAPKEEVRAGPEIPVFQQIVILTADGKGLAYIHILDIPKPFPFISNSESPGILEWIALALKSTGVDSYLISPERIANTYGFSIFYQHKQEKTNLTAIRTMWCPKMKIEENLVKDEVIAVTSFMGVIPTAHLLKTLKVTDDE